MEVDELQAGLERLVGQLHDVLPELVPGRWVVRRRQPDGLLAGSVRVRTPPVSAEAAVVRADAGYADAALSRDADPAVCAVPEARLDRHVPAARRAEVPRCRRVLHLSDGAVLPRHSARARRSGDDGRLRTLAHLLEDPAAAVDAGARDGCDLLVHLVV